MLLPNLRRRSYSLPVDLEPAAVYKQRDRQVKRKLYAGRGWKLCCLGNITGFVLTTGGVASGVRLKLRGTCRAALCGHPLLRTTTRYGKQSTLKLTGNFRRAPLGTVGRARAGDCLWPARDMSHYRRGVPRFPIGVDNDQGAMGKRSQLIRNF